nr:TnsD family Tn7-like transposition protein [uncultured Roseateles sp.]
MQSASAAPIDAGHPVWHDLANCGVQASALSDRFHFDDAQLASTYRRAAAARGLIAGNDRLCISAFGDRLATTAQPLRAIPELSALPSCPAEAVAQFARLLRQPRTGAHPLRHFTMILSLFGSWESFWTAYCAEPRRADEIRPRGTCVLELADPPPTDADDRKANLLTLIGEGKSISAAAAAVGIATGTAMAWAAQSAVSVTRRPKLLKPHVRRLVIRALRRGVDKQVVSESFSISVQTVTTTLRTEVGLADAWHEARFMQAKRRAHADWLAMAARHPHATYTDIRRMNQAAFAWLYRNDRAWLEEQAKRQPAAPKSNHARIDWDARDQSYANQIAEVCLLIATKNAATHVTMGTLCQALPSLKPLLSKLDRMPLTSAALKQATRRRPAEARRQLDMTNSW